MTPHAEPIPHPTVAGGWTLRDPLHPNGTGLYVSKTSAEAAAAVRNQNRRQMK